MRTWNAERGTRNAEWGTRRAARAGFTIPELLIAIMVVAVIGAGALIYTSLSGRSLAGIYAQSVLNQKAAHVTELMVRQIRLAHFVSNDTSGNTLYLGFDNNVEVDSNADGAPYNDVDRFEIFQFQNGDGNDATLQDNRIIYKPNASLSATQVLLARGVRKLPGQKIFTVTNGTVVLINFGLLDEYVGNFSQAIEIKTRALRRNTTRVQ